MTNTTVQFRDARVEFDSGEWQLQMEDAAGTVTTYLLTDDRLHDIADAIARATIHVDLAARFQQAGAPAPPPDVPTIVADEYRVAPLVHGATAVQFCLQGVPKIQIVIDDPQQPAFQQDLPKGL